MAGFLPDPLTFEILNQGDNHPCRIRLTLPDGSGSAGELDLAALTTEIAALQNTWTSTQTAQTYGQALFQALFPGNLVGDYSGAVMAARERGIRLALHLDENLAALHRIPWERMFQPQGSQWTPLAPS